MIKNTVDDDQSLPGILLVDDDEVFCEVLARALNKRDYEVYTAHDQIGITELAREKDADYAIVDLRIGADSGLAVIKELLEINPELRIVVLTGFASISTAVEAIKLGAVHYLTKPAEADDILKAFYHDEGDENAELSERPMSAKRLEWEHLQKVLNDYDGNISAAARAMGMHRRTLQRKLAKKPVQN